MNKLPGASNAVFVKSLLSTIHSELLKMKTASADLKVQEKIHIRKDSNTFAHEANADIDAD